ncbi:hypothetical protein L21SP5_00902 [Salinivirga cyanobacteriivorans]|uniref:DUF2784 domain-containing protein n=1 Tax=Salinivirga cyanobacteriivorans TaxID=1307839 RepID=A0A0S2HWY6_9BACT|nr:DUF2784 domain-containing protein [Salinivirga cyanobacteriivorans]ALO14570.1 hypothetical protein L21SP5_00902 [Salinivirga cyanobacteriivorans]
MNSWFWHAADIFFVILHTCLILFNIGGWLWKKTRRWNLALLLLTGASWSLLGLFYGMGYCPLTDWHFQVLEKLGHTNLPSSYILYLYQRLTGLYMNPATVDKITLIVYLVALILSIYFNFRHNWLKKHPENQTRLR